MEANSEVLNQFFDLLIDLDDLDIGQKVNEGSFYEVHKAENHTDKTLPTRKECCIKFRKSDSMTSANDQRNFFNEIQHLYSLKHETILSLIGYAIPKADGEKYAIITDYMPHSSLFNLIK